MVAYIVTRNRLDNLNKIVPRWISQKIPVVLVVEKSEMSYHQTLVRAMGWNKDIDVISPFQENRGVGHARRIAVTHASKHGHNSIIMSDDDLRPAVNSDMGQLLAEAGKPGVLGIGAVRGIHDRFSNGAISANDGVILCPGGWGMQLFALNINMTLGVGSFDVDLDCFGEDHELMRNGISYRMPWLVHCGVYCEPIGVRYDPGGLNAYVAATTPDSANPDRSAREIRCREIIYRRWPDYVSKPEQRPRMAWQKMLDDYIPYWRNLSAIHGGEWRR